MKRLPISVVAFFVIALIAWIQQKQGPEPVSRDSTGNNPATGLTSESATTSSSENFAPARTKSNVRTVHHKPTIRETTKLLRSTILPKVDIPGDQTLIERAADINKLIRKAGVEPRQLTLIVGSSESFSKLRVREKLTLSQVSVAEVLQYHCGSTRVRYWVRENGIVEFADMLENRDAESATSNPDKSDSSGEP